MNISIALATYNGERWLREQLDSLARQTLRPSELVISDDQSSDGTLAVVREFAARSSFPVRVVQNDVRRGFADNFINALRHCGGDAVAYCDQDDVWRAWKLERCVSAMSAGSGATLILHDCEEVDADLSPLGIIVRAKSSPASDPAAGRCRVIRHPALGCCMLLHRRVVDAVLRYWPESHLRYVTRSHSRGALGHDTVAVHLATVLGKVVYLSDPLIQHRRHSQNTWSPDLASVLSSSPVEFQARIAMLQENSQTGDIAAAMFKEMSDRAEAAGDGNAARYLARLAERDLESARFFAARAELYGARSRLARLARFSRMLRAGAYAGVGGPLTVSRCAFKDLAYACIGQMAPMLLEKVRRQLRLDFHPQELIK
jgi:glycosyltransferase involved in cell wall biosynthesis